jgi:stress-induced morphogen
MGRPPVVPLLGYLVPVMSTAQEGDLRVLSSAGMSERLEELLRSAFPDAGEITVVDRTGGGDHFHVTVVDREFAGLSLVDAHRRVYEALAAPLADGAIHELRITTRGEG